MLNILKIPNDILRTRSKELDRSVVLSEEIQKLTTDMIPTMYEADGIGLAAPQVGKNIRLCVIGKEALKLDMHNTLPIQDLALINPEWTKITRHTAWDMEGCLSVPKKSGRVKRYTNIHVKALDKNGNPLSFDAHDYFARVIQHEVDHLDGILFIDKAKDIYATD